MKIRVTMHRAENCYHYDCDPGDEIALDVEEYVRGVVPSEIGNAHVEACKAQAVAARTMATHYAGKGWAISDQSSSAQAYRIERALSAAYPNAREAVEATAGEVLTYDGKVLDTVSYSASNGGHTVSAKERWPGGSGRAWLISQPDPWDAAATGGKRTGHGVGMSQAGAKYAAQRGVTYDHILAFYYPRAVLCRGYGDEPKKGETGMFEFKDITGEKTAEQLASFTDQLCAAHQPYWMGTCAYRCTKSLYNSKAEAYPSHYPKSLYNQRMEDIREARIAADCVGIYKGFMWWDAAQGKAVRNTKRCPDSGATATFDRCTVKGPIDTMPDVPGLVLWKPGHFGVHIGGGKCGEARGRKEGIIYSEYPENGFTHWGCAAEIDYSKYKDAIEEATQMANRTGKATVTTKYDAGLGLWSQKSTGSRRQILAPKGAVIEVTRNDGDGWCYASYGGKEGYAQLKYLAFLPEEPEKPEQEPDEDVTVEQDGLSLRIDIKCATQEQVEEILEKIAGVLGRV